MSIFLSGISWEGQGPERKGPGFAQNQDDEIFSPLSDINFAFKIEPLIPELDRIDTAVATISKLSFGVTFGMSPLCALFATIRTFSSVTARFLGVFFDVLVLPLFFVSHSPQVFFSGHGCTLTPRTLAAISLVLVMLSERSLKKPVERKAKSLEVTQENKGEAKAGTTSWGNPVRNLSCFF